MCRLLQHWMPLAGKRQTSKSSSHLDNPRIEPQGSRCRYAVCPPQRIYRLINPLCPIFCSVTPVKKAHFHQYKNDSSRLPFSLCEEQGCKFDSVPSLPVSLQLSIDGHAFSPPLPHRYRLRPVAGQTGLETSSLTV